MLLMGFPTRERKGRERIAAERRAGALGVCSVEWPQSDSRGEGQLNALQASTQRQDLGVREDIECDGNLIPSPSLGCYGSQNCSSTRLCPQPDPALARALNNCVGCLHWSCWCVRVWCVVSNCISMYSIEREKPRQRW